MEVKFSISFKIPLSLSLVYIYPKNLQFADYGQFVLVFFFNDTRLYLTLALVNISFICSGVAVVAKSMSSGTFPISKSLQCKILLLGDP